MSETEITLPNLTALVAALTALAMAIGAILVTIKGLRAVNKSLIDEDGKPKLDRMSEGVSDLAKNIDGRMEELKGTIAEKNLAVGHAEGLAAGRQASTTERQARVAETERVEDREADKTR